MLFFKQTQLFSRLLLFAGPGWQRMFLASAYLVMVVFFLLCLVALSGGRAPQVLVEEQYVFSLGPPTGATENRYSLEPHSLTEYRAWLDRAMMVPALVSKPVLGAALLLWLGGGVIFLTKRLSGRGEEPWGALLALAPPLALFGAGFLFGSIVNGSAFLWYAKLTDPQTVTRQLEVPKVRVQAVLGQADAQYELGKRHELSWGVSSNRKRGIKWIRRAARGGHLEAQWEMYRYHAIDQRIDVRRGDRIRRIEVPRDEVEAVKWLRLAAEQGDARSQHRLGMLYLQGRGVPEDAVESVRWFRKAAGNESRGALFALNYCYALGIGTEVDWAKAYAVCLKAAERGAPAAQFMVSRMYEEGWGTPQNAAAAEEWIRRLGGPGGRKPFEGRRVFKDAPWVLTPESAAGIVVWDRKAAERGDIFSQFKLAQTYETGGRYHDLFLAYKWYYVAAASGHSESAESRVALEKKLSREQLVQAQRLARARLEKLALPE